MINLINHYHNGMKLYDDAVKEIANRYNIKVMELNILLFLFNHKQYDTAADIIKYRHLTKSHVSTSIKSLINEEYLIPSYQGNNNKSIHLSLSEKALKIAKDGREAQIKLLDLLLTGFSKEEKAILQDFYQRIDNNIEANLK